MLNIAVDVVAKATPLLGVKKCTVTSGEKQENAEKLLCRGLTEALTLKSEAHKICQYSLLIW